MHRRLSQIPSFCYSIFWPSLLFADDKLPAAGLLDPPEVSSYQNYMHQSLEPFLVGSGVPDDSVDAQTSAEANFPTHGSSLSSSSSTKSSASDSSLPAAVPPVSTSMPLSRNGTITQASSLFDSSHVFQSYAASPSIAALGLAEGLLPEEELVTHYWSKPQSFASRFGINTLPKLPHTSRGAKFGPMSQLTGLVNAAKGP